jgi:hypothetical protein
MTGADVGDSLAADAPIQGDEAAVYADKAYDSGARRQAVTPSPQNLSSSANPNQDSTARPVTRPDRIVSRVSTLRCITCRHSIICLPMG